jgi:hypothetical protein
MGNTQKKKQKEVPTSAPVVVEKPPEKPGGQSQASLLAERPPAQQLNSKEIRKKSQERLIQDAKDVIFYFFISFVSCYLLFSSF